MKTRIQLVNLGAALLILGSCSNDSATEESSVSVSSALEIESEESSSSVESSKTEALPVSIQSETAEKTEIETVPQEEPSTGNLLSPFSSEEIEYARIWLMLGANQEIDRLYVSKLPAGTLVNPLEESSATYSENVVQLAGSRLVDGSVTYSSNGDGTINVYNVPLRWESNLPEDLDENAIQELTQNIIDNPETVYVDPGDDEAVLQLIELIEMQ